MEKWEKELREKLQAEMPERLYTIGSGKLTAVTGKAGYIDYRVAMQQELRKLAKQHGIYKDTEQD